jgi:Na+/glutamate symporter
VFQEYGAGQLVEVGLGLATIGMVTGVVIGTLLVNYAISHRRSLSRDRIRPRLTRIWTSTTTSRVLTRSRWTNGRE